MSTLKKMLVCLLLSLLLSTTVNAASGEAARGWIDSAKEAGSNVLDWAKEKASSAKDKAPVVKEKAGEVLDKTKQKASQASDDFKEWRQDQENEFWERTQEQLGSETNDDEGSESVSDDGTIEEITEAPEEISEIVEPTLVDRQAKYETPIDSTARETEDEVEAEAETGTEDMISENGSKVRKTDLGEVPSEQKKALPTVSPETEPPKEPSTAGGNLGHILKVSCGVIALIILGAAGMLQVFKRLIGS